MWVIGSLAQGVLGQGTLDHWVVGLRVLGQGSNMSRVIVALGHWNVCSKAMGSLAQGSLGHVVIGSRPVLDTRGMGSMAHRASGRWVVV